MCACACIHVICICMCVRTCEKLICRTVTIFKTTPSVEFNILETES